MKRFLQISFTVIVILAMFLPGWAGGATDVQAAAEPLNQWPAAPTQTATTGNPTVANFTVSAGTNRLLVVAIDCNAGFGGASGQTFAVTYGGTSLTQAVLQNSSYRQTWIGYLPLGDSVSNTIGSLAVTVTGTHSNVTVWAASYSGIDQTNPITGSSSSFYNSVTTAQFPTTTTVNAGGYGLYTWSSRYARASDNEAYTEHGESTTGFYSGVASKAFASAGTTRPTVTFQSGAILSMSLVTLNPKVGNAAPVVNAGPDQLVAAEDLPAALNGTVTDDGFGGSTYTTLWSQDSGPGTATFTDATNVITTVGFSAFGTYVLRLTATDSLGLSGSDTVTITYQANTAPVVNGEPEDQTITGSGTANLTGAITDDGLPKVYNTLNSTWSLVSGPGACTIGTSTYSEANDGASTHNTTISACTAAGDYTFKLEASDGVLSAYDEVVVHVTPSVTATANGAAYALIIHPTDYVNLSGTAVTPSGTTWSEAIGPGSVTFGDASAVTTTATFTVPGRYYLRLTANGSSPSIYDEVVVDYVATPSGYLPPVQTFYMTLPEGDALTVLDDINAEAATPIISYASIAVGASGTMIYYDQWEDGYVSDYTAMTTEVYHATTKPDGVQVWGNGNCADGYPPNIDGVNAPITCTPSWDTLVAGDVIILEDSVDIPNDADPIDYDARDKISATQSISMAHALWATTSGTLNAFGHEMYPTADWGKNFEAPVGENLTNDGQMFEISALSIMASEDDTSVYIDTNGDGVDDISLTGANMLDEGGTYFLANVDAGAYVHADKPIQVLLVTGDDGSNYESRDINLLPESTYGSSYWSPVGVNTDDWGTTNTGPTRLWLYNPDNGKTIYVRCEGGTAPITQTVVPNSSVTYDLADNQAGHCYAVTSTTVDTPTDDLFFGIGTIDTGTDNSTGQNGQAGDWSFTLYPDDFLTTEALVGLGLGQDPKLTSTENSSPLWVTSTCDSGGTYIYVDWNNDGTADKVDFNGDKDVDDTNVNGLNETTSDQGFLVNRLVSVTLYDPTDDDLIYNQTGARVWSRKESGMNYGGTPGCSIALAWGQDPRTSTASNPGLDVGTTVPPLRGLEGTKVLTLIDDRDGDGQLSPGDGAQYNITIKNAGIATLHVHLFDEVPEHTTYVEDSTEWKLGGTGGWNEIPDDNSGTPFPLDDSSGVDLGFLEPGMMIYARFNIILDTIVAEEDYYDQLINCEVTYTDEFDLERCATTRVAIADWGDLPDVYKTTAAQDGPRHVFFPGTRLGTYIDFEPQGQPTTPARGDDQNPLAGPDDEDGVVNYATGPQWDSGLGMVKVTVTGLPGCLNGWMDINQDGDFGDAQEQIFTNQPVVSGYQLLPINITAGSLLDINGTKYYFRFRLTFRDITGACTTPVAPTGLLFGGEVEDYQYDLGENSAVDMTTFSAAVEGGAMVLRWKTENEVDNVGFNLYRAVSADGEKVMLNEGLIESLVPPGSTSGAEYDFTDTTAVPGLLYYYWLEDIDIKSTSKLHGPVEAQIPLAAQEMQVNFAAVGVKNVVLLTWETINETGIQGYNLYHATSADGNRTLLNRILIGSEVLSGEVDDAVYAYIDRVLFNKNKTHYYWLEIIDSSGAAALQGPFEAKSAK